MVKLTAEKEILLLNPMGGPQTASTKVHYELDGVWTTLWTRRLGGPWLKENLIEGADSVAEAQEWARRGVRTTVNLKAGDVVQYGILVSDIDPNMASIGRFRLLVTIYALLQTPAQSNLIVLNDRNHNSTDPYFELAPHGTYVFSNIQTVKPTHLIVKIGRDAPQSNPSIPYPDILTPTLVMSSNGLTQRLRQEMMPLVPGTHYHVVIRASDDDGNWQVVHRELDTKMRRVRIRFKEIVIHNDSDHLGWDDTGNAKFWFKVLRGREALTEFSHGRIDINDDEDDPARKFIPINYEHMVEPEPYHGNAPNIGIAVEGKEYDTVDIFWTWFETTDHASNFGHSLGIGKYINFPVGPNEASILNRETIAANPTDDSSLRFDVKYEWSVAYEHA